MTNNKPTATVKAGGERGGRPLMHSKQTRRRVRIGGKRVPVVVAALMGQEADRRHVAPSAVGRVSIPTPPPTEVTIAGLKLTVGAASYYAAVADEQGIEPSIILATVLEAHFGAGDAGEQEQAGEEKPHG